jgi:hypothetical protein
VAIRDDSGCVAIDHLNVFGSLSFPVGCPSCSLAKSVDYGETHSPPRAVDRHAAQLRSATLAEISAV